MNKKVQQRIVGLSIATIVAILFLPLVLPNDAPEPQHVPWKPLPKKPEASQPQPLAFDKNDLQQKIDQMQQQLEPAPETPAQKTESGQVVAKAPAATRPLKIQPANPTKPAWVIQLATLSSKQSAQKLVKQLHQKKIPAFYRQRKLEDRSLWRVMAGPELKKQLLEPYREQLLTEFPDLKIISYRPLG